MRSSSGQDLGSTAELAEACRPSLGLVRKKASNRKLSRATRLNVAAASSSSSGAGSADGGGVRRSMSEQQSNVRTTAVPFASACAVSTAAVPTAAASAAPVLVATKSGGAAAAPAPTVAAVTVVNFGSLQARLGEMEAVLRIGMESSDALKLAQAQVSESLAFLALLAAQAAERGVLQGAAFQALMASCGPSMGHLGRTPKGGTGVNSVFDDPMTTIQMAMQAQKLVNLVRVKIEDDNDLNLARQCLTDAQRGLAELSAHALKQGVSEYELYQKICGM